MSDNATPHEEPTIQYEPWERTPDWPHVTVEPVNQHGMLPRDARRLLEAAGQRIEKGVSMDALIKAVKAVKE
jgi:hypothetical protein